MDPRANGSTIRSLPRAIINRRGEAVMIHTLDDGIAQKLIEMYLAYRPRNSFQGLPPVKDEACRAWVQHMIGNGINVVALSFQQGVVGHVALFPIDQQCCELFVVVAPEYQNTGVGSELCRASIQVAYEIGFDRIWLDVEATNVRARHVYKKCGFQNVAARQSREVEMELDLSRYRELAQTPVAEIMNRRPPCIPIDAPARAALELMLCQSAAALPVIDEGGELAGLLSEAELLQPMNLERPVRDIYTEQVVTGHADWSLDKVMRLFQTGLAGCVPIVDAQRRLLGTIRRHDLLAFYHRRLPGPRGEALGGQPAADP